MACLAFETALQASDDHASSLHLDSLIQAGDFNGDALPSVAEKYLRAFCNTAIAHTHRRCIGLALAGMLAASLKVAEHFKSVEREQLHALGGVILSSTELEETKIIAGLIVRQALDQHIAFTSFWASEKMRNGPPNFP